MVDFTIVIASVVDIAFSSADSNLVTIRAVRLLRILRPMRLVTRQIRLQVALTTLIKAMPIILWLQVLTMFLVFILAIFHTNMFSGTFYRCYTEHLGLAFLQERDNILTKWDCLNYGGEWIRPDFNFDTLIDSYMTLSSIMSTEGWVQILWNVVDSNKVDY